MKKQLLTTLAAGVLVCGLGLTSCGSSGIKMIEIPGKDFKMSATEITQKQYEEVMGENPSWFQISNEKFDDEKRGQLNNTSNNPVEYVSWYDAIYFCNKLSKEKGRTPVYAVDGNTNPDKWGYTPHQWSVIEGEITQDLTANGFRLPTVEEWQYAARGGKDYEYSGSDNLDEVGWYVKNSGGRTHPVAQKKANGYGLYDMSGNVWEWCWDVYPNNSSYRWRCSCGGGYGRNDLDRVGYCEVSYRNCNFASDPNLNVGFRIVCSASNTLSAQTNGAEKKRVLDSFGISKLVKLPGKDLRILNTEVTQLLYQTVMGENPSKFEGKNNPVEWVSWYDAIYFCNKLSKEKGRTPVYAVDGNTDVTTWNYTPHKGKPISGEITQNTKADGFRLPTVEEWQYASRGGKDYTYSGSNDLDEVGWYYENSGNHTHPVAQKKTNGYGLYDMSGNVWEWCWDFYPDISNHRYRRGGSYYYHGNDGGYDCKVSRSYDYDYDGADYQYYDVGFRVVCSASN